MPAREGRCEVVYRGSQGVGRKKHKRPSERTRGAHMGACSFWGIREHRGGGDGLGQSIQTKSRLPKFPRTVQL